MVSGYAPSIGPARLRNVTPGPAALPSNLVGPISCVFTVAAMEICPLVPVVLIVPFTRRSVLEAALRTRISLPSEIGLPPEPSSVTVPALLLKSTSSAVTVLVEAVPTAEPEIVSVVPLCVIVTVSPLLSMVRIPVLPLTIQLACADAAASRGTAKAATATASHHAARLFGMQRWYSTSRARFSMR